MADRLDALRGLARRLGTEFELSDGPDDLTARARRAVDAGVDRLLVAGGDGTLHYALQALAGSETVLGLLPLGRADDFAGAMGLPRDLESAIDIAVHGEARRVDLGQAGARWFAGIASVGLDGEACRIANADSGRLRGPLVYALAGMRAWRVYEPVHVRVTGAFEPIEGKVIVAAFANSPRYGGGLRLAPEARMDDGLLDVVVVRRMSLAEVTLAIPSLIGGRHLMHPSIRFVRDGLVMLEAPAGTELYADGERICVMSDDPVTIRAVPSALRIALGEESFANRGTEPRRHRDNLHRFTRRDKRLA